MSCLSVRSRCACPPAWVSRSTRSRLRTQTTCSRSPTARCTPASASREPRSSTLRPVPEGDALHRAARRLQPLVGQRLEAESPNPRGQVTGVAERIDGRVLESVEAVGKNLLLRFEGGVVVRSHLRMTGRWRLDPRGKARVGKPWLVVRGEQWEGVLWNGPVLTLEARNVPGLGPDVLGAEFDVDAVVARIRRGGDRPLGEALRKAVAAARRLMRASLESGRPGRNVYRRAGRPCPRCGTIVRSRGQGDANRTAYWCPGCQEGGAPPGE